ncbi:hypothetical protein ACIQY8_05880 [Streptomyces albidoflavus]
MLPIMPDPNTPQGLEPLSPEYLAEIAARTEAATAGPWCTDGAEIYQGDEYVSYAFWVGETCRADEADGGTVDAAFIAHARTDVPALLAEVERLRAALSSATDVIAARDDEIGDWSAKNARLRAELTTMTTVAQSSKESAPGLDLDLQAANEEIERLRAELSAERALAADATAYSVLLPESGGTEVRVARQSALHGASWSAAIPRRGGGIAWTREGWQEAISALSVDRLFCWPDARTAIEETRRALGGPADEAGEPR